MSVCSGRSYDTGGSQVGTTPTPAWMPCTAAWLGTQSGLDRVWSWWYGLDGYDIDGNGNGANDGDVDVDVDVVADTDADADGDVDAYADDDADC